MYSEVAPKLDAKGIDVFDVNLIRVLKANNSIFHIEVARKSVS